MILRIIKRAFQTPEHDTALVRRLQSLTKHLNSSTGKARVMPRKKVRKKATVKRLSKPVTKKIAKPQAKPLPSRSHSRQKVAKKKLFHGVPDHHAFYVHGGKKLRSVYELIDALELMNDDSFKHHVQATNNDFANWVRDVFQEKGLASHLEKVRSKQETQKVLLKHMVRELSRLK